MTVQTFYPVFESGQVLTEAALNDIIDYLEPQDRLSRSRLTGIGVVCGLKPDLRPTAPLLRLSKGVAVTSEGYLITLPDEAYDRVRPYTVPVPAVGQATDEERAAARYSFLFDGNVQRPAFELLPPSFVSAPGEAAPTPLTAAFLADKTVMLFLERRRDGLKNCDVNDCSDKGSSMSLTVRRLLVSRQVANQILGQEETIAGLPVNRALHPRLGLTPLSMGRLTLAANGAPNYPDLVSRQMQIALTLITQAQETLIKTYAAYAPAFGTVLPPNTFDQEHFLPMLGRWALMPVLTQNLYDAAHDLMLSANEFIAAAALYDAECAPDEARFPRHVLLGDAEPQPRSFDRLPRDMAELFAFDPVMIEAGPRPEMPPASRRHHFVPAPPFAAEARDRLLALYRRMVLLGQSYFAVDLVGAEMRITPSRGGSSVLGDRAIPASYRINGQSDLVANWSWPRRQTGFLSTVSAYALIPADPDKHPALRRDDAVDFYRIEGIVGHTLRRALDRIIAEKNRLGLSFSIQPVLITTGIEDIDQASIDLATGAMAPYLACRVKDMESDYLRLSRGFAAYLVMLLRVLGRIDAGKLLGRAMEAPTPAAPQPPERPALPRGIGMIANPVTWRVTEKLIATSAAEEKVINILADRTLMRIRGIGSFGAKGMPEMAKAIVTAGKDVLPEESAYAVYEVVMDPEGGGELSDRLSKHMSAVFADAVKAEAAVKAMSPIVTLMARASETLQTLSAESLGDFDHNRFLRALRGLQMAYEVYMAQAEVDPDKVDPDVAAANRAIIANQGALAAAGMELGSPAMRDERQRRLRALFDETVLPNYARSHPAVEHRAGVPMGGTFVLLYCPRNFLEKVVETAVGTVSQPFLDACKAVLRSAADMQPDLAAAQDAMSKASIPDSDDDLERFVVLGDLCLPTACCDADCVEEAFARGRKTFVPRPFEPTPVEEPVVTGALEVFVVSTRRGGIETPLKATKVEAKHTENGAVTKAVTNTDGFARMPLPVGRYAVSAFSGRQTLSDDTVEVNADRTTSTKLVFE